MFVGGGGGGGGDAMELKYFIDLFYGGGSCGVLFCGAAGLTTDQ